MAISSMLHQQPVVRRRSRNKPPRRGNAFVTYRATFIFRKSTPYYSAIFFGLVAWPRNLPRQMSVEECGLFVVLFLGLGCFGIGGILRMRLPFEHMEVGDDAGLTQLAMHAHCIGQEQVARTRGENGRREA